MDNTMITKDQAEAALNNVEYYFKSRNIEADRTIEVLSQFIAQVSADTPTENNEQTMKTEELCKDIANSISNGFFYAGEYSGFKHIEKVAIEKRLISLVDLIKQEIKEELRNGY